MDINKLLQTTVSTGSSDLHLIVPAVPTLRINGILTPIEDEQPVTPKETKDAFEQLTTEKQREVFYRELELDFAYSLPGVARFRVNIALQRGSINLSMRCVPIKIPTIEEYGLPDVCKTLALKPRGLVLVTGPTGCGKSTTLAAMIDYLNDHEKRKVICIEDPIEFLHKNKKCLVAQRDLVDDTRSFSSALKHGLRQDPDVILVGEMRDLETISTAITAAETGHLVLSTLHTIGAAPTIDRIIDVFPPYQQPQIRAQLALVLEAVLSQVLIPRIDGHGRIAGFEIMLHTYAIGTLIRESRTYEIPAVLEVSSNQGMITLDRALAKLVEAGLVPIEEALTRAHKPIELKSKLHHLMQQGDQVRY
ncbi:type IV pilus twitching motility protein PilT [Chloroflexota bacterium]